MKQISIINTALKLTLVSVVALQVACSTGTSSTPPADTTVSGTIVAAPVNGADVIVIDANGNEVVKAVKTNADGRYTLVIPNGSLGQDLIIKSSGGTFVDEATGNPGAAGEMLAYVLVNSLSNGSRVSATPGSTIIAHLVMNHGESPAKAGEIFANAFGYTPDLSIDPADATGPAADASDESKLAGFRAAAFSQLAMDLGLSQNHQFELFAALAQDLADGTLDGGVAIGSTGFSLEANIQNRFAQALVNFKGNGRNMTKLNNAQIGNLPFAKVAFTKEAAPGNVSTYQVKYEQMGKMDAMEGKSIFQIRVTNRDGGVYSGPMPTLVPTMHMAAHHHSTPMPETAITDEGNGLYTVTLYYLMPSQMMGGISMGYWDLEFTVNNEIAHFYPAVMMAMGDTALVKLSGVDDKIMSMMTMTMEGRPYRIFKENMSGDSGSYDFSVFVVAQQDMMNFPALKTSLILNEGNMMSELVIDCPNIEVSVSANDGDWSTATSGCKDGIWTIGLTLNDAMDEQNQIKVRLTVNGEVKTTDGATSVIDTNDFQTFTITPNPSMSMM